MSRHQLSVLSLSWILLSAGCPADESVDHDARDDGGVASEPDDEGPRPRPNPDGDDEPDADPGADESASDPDPLGGGDHGDDDEPSDPAEPSDPTAPDDPADPDPGGAARFFLPTPEPENTRAPELLFDAGGNLHAIYPAYAGGDAYYAFCPNNCDDPDAMQVVPLQTEGTVLNAMLALTRAGEPRVLLATGSSVVWAECSANCTDTANWHSSVILEHGGDREVSGNALALDAQDRPRFVMHTYLALLGVGQKPPQTFYVQCDSGCTQAGNWQVDTIQEQIWQNSELRFDAANRAHLATIAVAFEAGVPSSRMAAYLVCEQDCTSAATWSGIGLFAAYESYSEEIAPAIALALTENGGPRVVVLGKSDSGGKNLVYFECDSACDKDNWRGSILSDRPELGAGLDIEVDANDRPRFVFTLDDNIGLYHCDAADCTAADAQWDLAEVEFAADVPPDGIILWPNCTIDAWVLHDPSLALGANGSVRVGYQATDLSGGVTTQDPTKPACVAGTDMTLSRMTLLPSYEE
jgi:hypothetical protein